MTESGVEPYRLYVVCKRDMIGPDGTRVLSVLAQPKRLCLLTYLALSRQPVSRSKLTALFWPDADEVRARNNLNQAVHFLRRSTSKNVVESLDGEQLLWVAPERLWCDARDLLHGKDLNGDLEGAADRDVLEGWNAEDSQPLQEWLDTVRREARARVEDLEASKRQRETTPAPEGGTPSPAAPDAAPASAPVTPVRMRWLASAAAAVFASLIAWALLSGPPPESSRPTPAPSPVTIVFPSPVLVALDDTHPVLSDLIRLRILARLTGIPEVVVQEAFTTDIAWDRRQLAALNEPSSRMRYLEVITIVSGDRVSTSVALVGAGGSVGDAWDTPFSNDPELLSAESDQIADRVARVVARNLGSPARTIAISADPLPPVFGLLAGEWVGEGTLFGRPVAFTIRWTFASDSEIRLDFTNGVLEAVAIYTVAPTGQLVASWTDDRPQAIDIQAEASDSSVVSFWTAPEERGRTDYTLESDGGMTVRDWVVRDGELQPFGEASYRRAR